MGLEDVTAEIRAEAEEQVEQILAEAEERKEEILQQAAEQRDEILDTARNDAEQEAEALRKKEVSSARMAARKQRQAARQEVLNEVFTRFREQVHDLGADEEQELVESALDRLDDRIDIGTVTTAERNKSVASDYGDAVEADVDGIIVESADGTRRFDLTFDTVADRVIEEHRQEVAEEVFK